MLIQPYRLDELLADLLEMKRREPIRWNRDVTPRSIELKIDVVEVRGDHVRIGCGRLSRHTR